MIDLLVKDLDKEMTEAETSEKASQADYKSLQEKTSAKAELESALEDHKEDEMDAKKELMATLKVIHTLHGECDWLVKYFDVRKEARADEVDSLEKAKAVLSGADYSL